MMPIMNGMSFYNELCARHPDVAKRLVLVTGGAVSGEAGEFVRSFPNPTLTKPTDMSALRTIVAEYVSSPAES